MNSLRVYHLAQRDYGVDRDVCISESVLRSRERGEIGPVESKRAPKKFRAGYAPTKDKIKDDHNDDDDNNYSMEDVDPDSKAPRRKARDLMWENRGTGIWAPNYREQ